MLKYFIQSSHDTQQWNVLKFLQPVNYEPIDQPYATTIIFELHYDANCMGNPKTRSSSCFTVNVLNNGEMLKFDTCINNNNSIHGKFTSPICRFDSFIKHWNKVKYQGDVA